MISRGNDPVNEDFRVAFGVEDKDKFVWEAMKEGGRRERRSSKCVVCEGDKNSAVFGQCEIRSDVECNCCIDHRKKCPLK